MGKEKEPESEPNIQEITYDPQKKHHNCFTNWALICIFFSIKEVVSLWDCLVPEKVWEKRSNRN